MALFELGGETRWALIEFARLNEDAEH